MQTRLLLAAAATAVCTFAISEVNALTIGTDFEGGLGTPAGWNVVNTGSSTYQTTAGVGNPGQAGRFVQAESNTASPNIYLVNDGPGLDANAAISGSFDYYLEENENYSTLNFLIGDIDGGLGGSAGDNLNVRLQRKTFGARAELRDGDDVVIPQTNANNDREVNTLRWLSADFTWTPTSGTTGDFTITWDTPTSGDGVNAGGTIESLSVTGYTFNDSQVFFGFGTGRNDARFDNISIEGTEWVDPNAIPSPSAALAGLIGMGALISRRRRQR